MGLRYTARVRSAMHEASHTPAAALPVYFDSEVLSDEQAKQLVRHNAVCRQVLALFHYD
eukprot:m.117845 g.117845  ORF g.117845 m.117845 type:complete len:59 (+) comp51979_c0_seq1:268-444(+)